MSGAGGGLAGGLARRPAEGFAGGLAGGHAFRAHFNKDNAPLSNSVSWLVPRRALHRRAPFIWAPNLAPNPALNPSLNPALILALI